MAITGGVKFFTGAKNLLRDGASITASTNDAISNYLLNYDLFTRWISSGSDDTTQETLEIALDSSITIDRILVRRHNWKEFTAQYWNGSAFVDFTTAFGIDGALGGGISETAFSQDTAYYEFAAVSTTRVKFTIDKTQTVDAEKEAYNIYLAEELGTLEGFPRIEGFAHSKNIKRANTLSGKAIVQKSYDAVSFNMFFRIHPKQNDIDLIETLHDREDTFLTWICGGRYGTSYFRFDQRGWRLRDIYNMQTIKPLETTYAENIYTNGINSRMQLVESV